MDIRERKNILVTCGPGLEDYLQTEIKTLDIEFISTHPGGVLTKGSFIDCMSMNLNLRTAYNVLYLIREFRCGSPEALYKQITNLPWEKIISPEEQLCVLSRVDTWSIKNTMFPTLKVKDAIVDKIQNKTGQRPDSGQNRNGAVVNLFWKKDKAWIYLNTSGIKLSDRNYRKMPHKAPLRESLAAGILMAADYDGSQHIVLPMCGSGTLAIEAALIAMNKPAGILRSNFGFKHFIPFDEQPWKIMRAEARKQIRKAPLPKRIIATDIDNMAIAASKQNAKTAGVDHLIEFDVCDFAETPLPLDPAIVLMNPEYSQRMGDLEELEKDYKRIGDFFKQKCPGHTGYVFTGNRDLAKKIGLKTAAKIPFYNGNIECRLLKFNLYKGKK